MNCRMSRGIYLRANGEVNCYCSTGEQLSIAQLPTKTILKNFIKDYYMSGKFTHIRESLSSDRLPFPEHCLKCNYLDPLGKYDDGLLYKEIEWAHIEPVYICNLECPFCSHGIPADQRKYTRSKPYSLPKQLYDEIISSVARKGINIKWMYFSGRGEPGLHPDIWQMVEKAKDNFDTNFLVNTNGNINYDDQIVSSGLDKIKIAVDSVNQATYQKYRINGDVNQILNLTQNIVSRKQSLGVQHPQIIWQKVMFNFNDSEEELIEYQQRAIELGVDLIKLVFTWTAHYSEKRPHDIPKIFPNIEIHDTYEHEIYSIDSIKSEIEKAELSNDIGRYVKAASRILHSFKLNIVNRDEYDDYSNYRINNIELYKTHDRSIPVSEIKMYLTKCFVAMALLYRERGDESESERYEKFVEAIPL